ncbi:MAG: c-type cytochrome biogenesis protein CcsB [Thermodesulfovibrionales bacterium]|nr:c-type cytochrome biogenesis protein CcsB [Thermodesulfovibrionales bacterium]
MRTLLFEIALTFYFAGAIVSIVELWMGSRATSRPVTYIAIGGFLFHTLSIIMRYLEGGYLPITNLHEASSFYAWAILLLFFFLESRYRLGLLGCFIMPLVFVLMLSSSLLPRELRPLNPLLESFWLPVHTLFAFLGNAAFALSFVIGIMYLIQEYYLKSKHPSGLFAKLPSLQSLDEINYKLITFGFPLLTLAIITGAIWSETAFGTYWRWDPKETWSLITWFIYALLLHARLIAGWRGRRAAFLSILGFIFVMFTFFGVSLLLKTYHSFRGTEPL